MVQDNVDLYCEECPSCHLLFWISLEHHNRLVKSKESFSCPNGHSQSYSGKTAEQKLKDCIEEKERLRQYWDDSCAKSNEYYDNWKKVEKELKKIKKPKKKKRKIKASGSFKKKSKTDLKEVKKE